jgi:hypothetical protein
MSTEPLFCSIHPDEFDCDTTMKDVFEKFFQKHDELKLCTFKDYHGKEVDFMAPKEENISVVKEKPYVLAKNKTETTALKAFEGRGVDLIFHSDYEPVYSLNNYFMKSGVRDVKISRFVCCQIQPTKEFHCFQVRCILEPIPESSKHDYIHFLTLQFCRMLYNHSDFLTLSDLDTLIEILEYFEVQKYPELKHVEKEISMKLCELIDILLEFCDLPEWDYLYNRKEILKQNF